ncbi:S53 family peptidase [Kitasatospora sp. MAP5-34]|uniref:S53 family peptidase n=1 Tax=Kitasatospora sp. MAP5-34 TaxID=3035102 RepID=UPI0024745B16|nr:S53 family peptidase [Kitasatospora sp. MAP5-34]MDH6578396.1 subtilase family serine protease [Kitasatospora sp. MAP5-34]
MIRPRPAGRHWRRLAGGTTAALIAGLLVPGVAAADQTAVDQAAATVAPQRIGSAPVAPAGAVRTAEPAAGTPLKLSVTLSPNDPGALQSFVAAVSTPHSPQYHQYLKTGQFAQRFGASKSTVAAVSKALTDAGLHPGPVEADGLTIPVSTTTAEAGRALHTGFAGYRLANGDTAYANTSAPLLPAGMAGAVTGLIGLDNLARVHSHLAGNDQPSAAPGASPGLTQPHFTGAYPQLCGRIRDWQANSLHRTDAQDYYSTGALGAVYGLDSSGLPDGAAGTTVAVFELEEYSDAAISAFQNCYGTHSQVSRIKIDGGPTTPANFRTGVGSETALDIETVVGMAPGANVLVYQGPDAANASDAAVLDTYRQIVTDNRAQVISSSWGICESAMLGNTATLNAENTIFMQAAAQGQSVVASSGDSGSTDCYRPGKAADTRLSTEDPASQPYVTAVGGTSMTGYVNPAESVWNRGAGASGGGVSQVWSLDSATGFQAGVTGAGYSGTPCHAAAGQACRQVPDVSALADPTHGYLVAVGVENGNEYWGTIGGTSGAAPAWAAVLAVADASVYCAANGPVGQINHALYSQLAHSAGLRDITVGNNDLTASGYTGGNYQAGQGYDLATGLGTPNGYIVATVLCNAVPQSAAGTFVPAGPTRLLDTRPATNVGAPAGQVASHTSLPLNILGQAGVPSGKVTAVVLNVTVARPTSGGFLTVYPSGGTRPTASNMNWTAGQTVPNLVTVPVGADGKVDLYNGGPGSTDLVADLFGYYTSDPTGATYTAAGPTRVLDTRQAVGRTGKDPVAPQSEVSLPIAGQAGVPATGVSAVILNVTVTEPTANGYLTVYPSGTTRPTSSNLNWTAGQTVPNLVIVPVGADGNVNLYNGSAWGSTHLVADVFGYFSASPTGAKFHSALPHRVMDTRSGVGAAAPGAALGGNQQSTLTFDYYGPMAAAKAVVLNVTVTQPQAGGWLTVWQANGQARPTASNLNWAPGQTVANLVTVPAGTTVSFYNGSWGATHLIVDLVGYYS